jgi:hypothetical protein
VTTSLQNLPPLTPDQTNVVIAMLGVDGRLIDAANFTDLPLGAFLDALESPEVRAHLDAAERAARRRARTRLADEAHEAIDVLSEIIRDRDHDKTERRRAATTILRTLAPSLAPPRRERTPASDSAPDADLINLARALKPPDPDPAPPRADAAPDFPLSDTPAQTDPPPDVASSLTPLNPPRQSADVAPDSPPSKTPGESSRLLHLTTSQARPEPPRRGVDAEPTPTRAGRAASQASRAHADAATRPRPSGRSPPIAAP